MSVVYTDDVCNARYGIVAVSPLSAEEKKHLQYNDMPSNASKANLKFLNNDKYFTF